MLLRWLEVIMEGFLDMAGIHHRQERSCLTPGVTG